MPQTGYTLEGYGANAGVTNAAGAERGVTGLSNVNNVISATDVTALLGIINQKAFFDYTTSKSEKMVHASGIPPATGISTDINKVIGTGLKPQYTIGTSANLANPAI